MSEEQCAAGRGHKYGIDECGAYYHDYEGRVGQLANAAMCSQHDSGQATTYAPLDTLSVSFLFSGFLTLVQAQ